MLCDEISGLVHDGFDFRGGDDDICGGHGEQRGE
jgi:hypothetical protein